MTQLEFENVYTNFVNLHEGKPLDPDYMIFIKELVFGGFYFNQNMMNDPDKYRIWNAVDGDELHEAYFAMLRNIIKLGLQAMHGPIAED